MVEKETVLNQNPINNNFLDPLNFKFILKRAPHVNFFLQKIIFPAINVPAAKESTPFVDIYYPGVDVQYSPLTITYRVDEDMQNYYEIYNWLMAIGEEEDLAQYHALEQNPEWIGKGIRSDIILTILDSARQANYTFYFHDSFPISMSSMVFDLTPNNIVHQLITVSFRFTDMDYEKVV